MNIASRGQKLFQRVSTDLTTGGTSITFVNPSGSLTKTIKAIQTKHMVKTDENGFKSVSKNASIAVSEAALLAESYPTRDANNEISLLQHKVTWTDVSGLTWTYSVRQNRPDEAVGVIILILDDYTA